MNTIISLLEFKERARGISTLVLVDLHEGVDVDGENPDRDAEAAIANCRAALRYARGRGFPIAFTRQVSLPGSLTESARYPRWIAGFEPKRSDMIFDRQHPSCYASVQFAEMVDHIGGNYVMAGRFGDGSCLSTAIDAFHRNHRATVLVDALVSRMRRTGAADASGQDTEACIISRYAKAERTQSWILGNGGSARARG